MKLKLRILLLCFGLLANTGSAQTCCSAGAQLSTLLDINNFSGKGLSIGLDYEYNSVNRLVDNNERLQNDPRTRSGQNYILRMDYVQSPKWAFSMFIPWVIQNRTTISKNETASGVGDLTFLSQYSMYFPGDLQLNFGMGIKAPTGNQYLGDERGINLSPDMQSGSGTIDYFGSLSVTKSHFFIPNLANQSFISYRYNTTNPHFGDANNINGRRFKFGNALNVTSVFNYLLVANNWFISPDLGIQFRHTSPNREEEFIAFNSGGNWLIIPMGIQFQPDEFFSFRIFSEFPIWEKLEGLQITTNYKLGLNFRYLIPFSNS